MSDDATLLGVPNFSEGANKRIIHALEATLAAHAEVLDVHFDAQHNRSVISIAASPERVGEALYAGVEHAIELIDMRVQQGLHPRIGAVDVCPVVYPDRRGHERASEIALELGERLGAELELPVFLYGDLASSEPRRERAYFRHGGPAELARRLEAGELLPDFGPTRAHETAGATLVTARPPLVAFNLELDTPNPEIASEIAAKLREAGGGPAGVRAIGLPREGERSQVSVNVHDPGRVPLAEVVRRVEELAAEHDASPIEAELIGLAPEAALAGYPEHPPIRDFDPGSRVLEKRLQRISRT